MVVHISRNGQKTIFWMGCACVSAYVAYRYWRKREFKAIDEGFEEISKINDCTERRVVLLGLDGAGKTSVMNQAEAADTHGSSYQIPPVPTNGSAVYKLRHGVYTYYVWEAGGGENDRVYWSGFLDNTDLLIFMVDAADAVKLSQAVLALKEMLGDQRLDNVPILVVANKQDVHNALRPDEIKEALDLRSISPRKHKVEVIGCQTRPLPESEKDVAKHTWYHTSIDEVRKKIFSLALTS